LATDCPEKKRKIHAKNSDGARLDDQSDLLEELLEKEPSKQQPTSYKPNKTPTVPEKKRRVVTFWNPANSLLWGAWMTVFLLDHWQISCVGWFEGYDGWPKWSQNLTQQTLPINVQFEPGSLDCAVYK
jgi:hypothetical protein